MSIIACPRCRDEVTLPPKVSPQARVRCPLCRDEYILSEALAAMPPALIVLDAGPDADTRSYAEPEYRVAGDAGVATAPGGVFDTTGPAGDSAVSTAPRPLKGAKPRKRKEGSALGMIVQVVLGGVAAIVIFQALAWWVMDKDPFEFGPVVSKYVPAIVPKRWHGKTNGTIEKPATNGSNNAVASLPTTKPNPKPKNNKAGGNSFDAGPQFNSVDPAGVNPLDVGPAPKVGPEPGEIKIDDALTTTKPDNPMPEKPLDFTPPMPKPVDPNLKSPASTLEIKTAYAQAVVKRENFEQATGDDPATRQAKGREMYDAAGELGKLCTNADWSDPENSDNLASIKEFAAQLKPRIAMLTFLADERLNSDTSKDSIVVAGVIKSFTPLGATQETTIEVARRDGTLFTVPVITTQSLEDEGAKLGDTIMVFGRIVRDPKKDLPKYKGEAPLVVQSGATTVLPAQ